MTIYKTGGKLEKHQVFVEWLKMKIALLESQKQQIDTELVYLRQKLAEDENHYPQEFQVNDVVRRKNILIPENEPGAAGMSVNTPYKITNITSKGLVVLEDYLMLVNPDYLELDS